jgi:hypothetical protein
VTTPKAGVTIGRKSGVTGSCKALVMVKADRMHLIRSGSIVLRSNSDKSRPRKDFTFLHRSLDPLLLLEWFESHFRNRARQDLPVRINPFLPRDRNVVSIRLRIKDMHCSWPGILE